MPEGFTLDNAENPGPLNFGKPGGYTLEMATRQDGAVICRRELVFGREGLLLYPQKTYAQLKQIFDTIHARDGVTISLKQDAK
jgi:hypothetical protein